MIVLGLSAFGYNPSACVVRDGKLLAFCQEDRLTRLKGSHGMFPSLSVKWCLSSNGLALQDIDVIAFSWGCGKFPWRMVRHLAKVRVGMIGKRAFAYRSSINERSNWLSSLEHIYLYSPRTVRRKVRDQLRYIGYKGPIPPIEFVDHHVSHAYQTFYQSAFQEASILVADGSGEENSVSGFSFAEKGLRQIINYKVPHSLGWYYGGFTAYLGFMPNRDEGKLMGLAAYGEARRQKNPWLERMDRILRVSHDGFELDPTYFKFGGNEYHPRFTDKLVSFITSHKRDLLPVAVGEVIGEGGKRMNKYLREDYVDLAYAVQVRLEQALGSLVRNLVSRTRIRNLCLSGGVFMNCKANGYLADLPEVDSLFVHPASSDDGASVGAAFYLSSQSGYACRNVLGGVQLGPSYGNDEIESILKRCSIPYSTSENVAYETARLLGQGKIVGWFQGGCEMGARALGGRSIIASVTEKRPKDRINNSIKFREGWRPYCPSFNTEYNGEFTVNAMDTPFMIVARRASEELRQIAPDVVHVDGSVRSQTVRKEVLPRWYSLLDHLRLLEGYPLVLNTSFNVRGEPIACSPSDAIRCFYSTGLDALVMEDHIIVKNS
jgi:carbamoyltransferase